jgi:MFS family permease
MTDTAHSAVDSTPDQKGIDKSHRKVIFASSLGTVFEWYDFFLYGSLAGIIRVKFFAGVNETTGFIFTLLAFAAGFAVRPFGALVFGRLGDMVGRKFTFLVTILIMGLSTALVGLLPTYATIGVAAPILLITLRLLQGLALGGEYGGAAVYVAEHAPPGKRGFYTSWIQTTATLGLFLSLLVILGCQYLLGDAFADWGWRLPFLLSLVLLGISVYIRLQLHESPVFQEMKNQGTLSTSPLKDSFGNWSNLKIVLLALFGATAGQAVVWYTGQFYALFFLTEMLQMEGQTANLLIACALLIGTPFFVVFGILSDKIGRKAIIMTGCLLAAASYFPIFNALTYYVNPAIQAASESNPVSVVANPETCSVQIDPTGTAEFRSSCDVAKSYLAGRGVPYSNETKAGGVAEIRIGERSVAAFEGEGMSREDFAEQSSGFAAEVDRLLSLAGYPEKADPDQINYPMVILLLSLLVILVTMVYGPIAAWLVELFPSRIRYTSMSLPYHIGNGWFGGFLPAISFGLVALTGNIYYGLWYPVIIALATAVIGIFFLRETKDDPL